MNTWLMGCIFRGLLGRKLLARDCLRESKARVQIMKRWFLHVFADPTLEWQLINSHGHQEFPHWAFPVWLQFPWHICRQVFYIAHPKWLFKLDMNEHLRPSKALLRPGEPLNCVVTLCSFWAPNLAVSVAPSLDQHPNHPKIGCIPPKSSGQKSEFLNNKKVNFSTTNRYQ